MKGSLPDQTRIVHVQLRTARLEAELEFYTAVLGLRVSDSSNGRVMLSAAPGKPALLVLSEHRKAVPRPARSTGLYHLALRYLTRNDLAEAYRRINGARYPLAGASDHGVSEAIYLTDPEGNGVELYTDRPRSQWHWHDGQIDMVTTPLSLDNLLTAKPKPEMPPEPELGHIHLHVADLAAAERFYNEYLGFAVTQRSYPGALFFAAGAYHHHIGVNIWAGKTSPPANSAGLISYRVEVPVTEILYCLGHRAPLLGYAARTESPEHGKPILQVRDPNGNWLEIQSHGGQ